MMKKKHWKNRRMYYSISSDLDILWSNRLKMWGTVKEFEGKAAGFLSNRRKFLTKSKAFRHADTLPLDKKFIICRMEPCKGGWKVTTWDIE